MASRDRGAPAPLYFVNGWVDHALAGGLSIAVYFLLKAFYTPERTPAVISLATSLAWVINWPHFSATSFRLYRARANVAQYPLTALFLPWLLAATVVLAFAYPSQVAPALVKLFLVWSPYHFSGQTVGVTVLYLRRAGIELTPLERRALWSFVFGSFLSASAAAETGLGTHAFYTVRIPVLGVPDWLPGALDAFLWAGGTLFLGLLLRRRVRGERIPTIVLIPPLAQLVWFYRHTGVASFREFVPMFHSLQYLLIAWSMQLRETFEARAATPGPRFVVGETVRWALVNAAGGATLFYVLPHLGSRFAPAGDPYPLQFATAVVISAVQVHHFFVDGVIWKLRRTTVVSPLLSSLGELLRGPASGEGPARVAS